MAKTKDEIAIERAGYAKTIRTIIRLKYSLQADREIARIEPALMAKFDAAVANGELYTLDADALDGVLNGFATAIE